MKILFATSNKNKVANAQAALGHFGISVEQVNLDLRESRSADPTAIALEKARQAWQELQHNALALSEMSNHALKLW